MRQKTTTTYASLLVVLLALTMATAQESSKFSITLKINKDYEQVSGQLIASGRNGVGLVYSAPVNNGLGQAPGGVVFKIEPMRNPLYAHRITIDSNGDGDLRNDTSQVVMPNSSIVVRINRKWVHGSQLLPYTIKYSREANVNGQSREHFMWMPHYRAEGRLKTKNCDALVAVFDLNSDGRFDLEDFYSGTSIGLDRNGDGSIWGGDEYLSGNQIIEYCSDAFLVENTAVDGTSVTLITTMLRVPKVGDRLPLFTLTTEDGQKIESASLRDKVHLLDFWASWCKPCVEKFSLVKRLTEDFKDDVAIIAINVDDAASLPKARQAIKDYGLRWPHVLTGLGETDPVWKLFGSIGGNRLAIPLYVLIDAEGRLRYAGNGGDDLSDLRLKIMSVLGKSQ